MDNVLTLVSGLFLVLIYWIKGIVMVFVPKRFRFKDVNNDVVLITGGGSGIGRLLAIRFHELGARVVIWDLNESGLKETEDIIAKNSGGKCYSYLCDVSDRNQVYETAAQVKRDVGSVDILINNAGIVNGKRLMELDDAKIEKTINVNIMAHFWTVKAVLPEMKNRNKGHIVTVASIAGLSGAVAMSDYSASKYAALGFEESLRYEIKSEGFDGIHSTLVCPYFITTGLFAGVNSEVIPFLTPEFVTESTVNGILINQEVVFIPRFMYFLNAMKSILPSQAMYHLMASLGGHTAMSTFVGRNEPTSFTPPVSPPKKIN